jgi:membrane protein
MIAKHLDDVAGFMPGGAVDAAREQLTRVPTKPEEPSPLRLRRSLLF